MHQEFLTVLSGCLTDGFINNLAIIRIQQAGGLVNKKCLRDTVWQILVTPGLNYKPIKMQR